MTGQSESEPMTMPTSGAPSPRAVTNSPTPGADRGSLSPWAGSSFIDVSSDVVRRVPRALTQIVEVVAIHRHMADLAPRRHRLAVPVHLQPRIASQDMPVGRVDVG